MQSVPGARIAQISFGAILSLLGLYFAGYGGWLVLLGDTPYYAVAGLAMIASGIQVARGAKSGFFIYAAVWLATLLWAFYESGLDPWKLEVRLFAPSVLLAAFLLPGICRPAKAAAPRFWRGFQAATALVAVLLIASILYASYGPAAGEVSQVAARTGPQGPTDWQHYGNDAGKTGFADLAQIVPGNVAQLEVAWTAHTGDLPDDKELHRKGREYHSESTPIKIGNTLYSCTPHSWVVATDATTGAQKWTFDPQLPRNNPYIVCRGVSYYAAPDAESCKTRVFAPTMDGRMYALDAETGAICQGFGTDGFIDLKDQTGVDAAGKAWGGGWQVSTSTPLVMNDRLVVGSRVIDNMSTDEPSGVVRAFDPVDGHQVWAWDVGRSEDALPGRLPEGESYTKGTPNVWGTITGDPKLNLVYLGTGNAAPDYYTAFRRPFDNTFGTSIVALDATTGKLRWHYQLVHNDMWDFDVPVGPSLFDMPDGTPALIQTTKMGEIFMFDRATGKPLVETKEMPFETSGAAPNVPVSPTQPVPVGMPSLVPEKLTPQDIWGATPIDQLACRIEFAQARSDGIFTPIGPTRSIGNPAFDGVTDWGGASVDPVNKAMFINTMNMPFYFQLVDRTTPYGQELLKIKSSGGENAQKLDVRLQENTPYLATLRAWLSPFAVPCVAPPWGRMVAIDLKTQTVLWTKTLGNARKNNVFGLTQNLPLPTGTPNLGGSLATSGGLVFVGATTDNYIRAFDARTGTELWRHELQAGGQANPMSYIGEDGRQYIVITAGGHGALGTSYGDLTVAFALPKTAR